MVRPPEVVDSHGVHEAEGPLLVGGVMSIAPRIGLCSEVLVVRHLRSDQAFRDYLEFREEAFRKAASEMISAFKSPVDLFLLTDIDAIQFESQYCKHKTAIQQYSMIVDEEIDSSGAASMSKNSIALYNERLLDKSSHMDLLKEHTSKLGSGSSSTSDYENVALERINSEMVSDLKDVLYYPDPDEWLMEAYFSRMKLKTLARECSVLAENTGITLVKEFMPVPVKEHTILPSLKQAVAGWISYRRGGGATRGNTSLRAFGGGAIIRGKTSWRALGLGIFLGAAATSGMYELELRPAI